MPVTTRLFRFGLAAVVVALLVGVTQPEVRAQQTGTDPCNITTTERIVAVGDIHGAHDRFVAILRAAELIDDRDRWSGDRALLVQLGDVLDRGPDSRKSLDLLRRLEGEAARAGGQVIALLGNHEVMRMIGDWRYISPQEDAAFRSADAARLQQAAYEASAANAERAARAENRAFDRGEYRKKFLEQIPLGRIEMADAFSADGEYGKWLRTHPTVARVNDVVFVHGGLSPETARRGCAAINAAVAADLRVPNPSLQEAAAMFSSSEDGPLWYRGLATEPEGTFAPSVEEILRSVGARAIVVGHSVSNNRRVTARFDGRVIQLDTGMLGGTFFPGGRASALEISGQTFTAIYEDGRELLSDVAPAVAATP